MRRKLGRRLGVSISVSITIHLLALVGLANLVRKPRAAISSTKVVITVIAKKSTPPPKVTLAGPGGAKSDNAPLPRNADTKLETLSYSDLMAITGSTAVIGTPAARQAYRGSKLVKIIAEGSDLSTYFDLPLVFRRQLQKGQASARLRHRSSDVIIVESIVGQPEIRAALYETLRHPHSFNKIRGLLEVFDSKNLKISIEYTTRYAPEKNSEFETTYRVFDNEMVIHLVRNLGIATYGVSVIPIEDRHSKRARKMDRDHLVRLRKSAAFRQILRNVLLHRPGAQIRPAG